MIAVAKPVENTLLVMRNVNVLSGNSYGSSSSSSSVEFINLGV